MIDFHSHILPGIDDGSKSVEMSLQMLRSMKAQGIDTVAATSHFYVTQRSVRRFLFRRQEAYEKLQEALPEDSPRILLGAEVLYFPGISRLAELPRLCLEHTNLLLLEMPFERWTEYAIREVRELAHCQDYTLTFAHIERYYSRQPVSVWDEFLELGVLMQANADFFLPFSTRRKALKLLKEGRIHLLGTDAHNVTRRAPRMAEARSMIKQRLGSDALEEIDSLGEMILREGCL